jgi:UDP:flavonoid glycosyltransferase YjiC (YdhE family)
MLTVGTRGDVLPYIALGCGLQAAGYQVRLATNGPYKEAIEAHGLEFRFLASDPQEVMRGARGKEFLGSGENVLRFGRRMMSILKENLQRHFGEIEGACEGADAILHSPLAFPGWHVAEALGIPSLVAAVQPATRTRAFPALPLAARWSPGGTYNLLTHLLLEQIVWQGLRSVLNRWRSESLGIDAMPLSGPMGVMLRRRTPVLYGFSPLVVPKPTDWPEWHHLTGYWIPEEPREWRAPAQVMEFIEAGPAPVYVGFSSMIPRDPQAAMDLALDALRRAGKRGILATGWMPVVPQDLPENVLVLDEIPHDWLFPRVSAVVHHGGAGTTAAAMRAGSPAVVVPFYADQPFWATRVAALGLGPPPIPEKKLTAEKLAHAITIAVNDEDIRRRSKKMGERLRIEDGVETAVRLVDRALGNHV